MLKPVPDPNRLSQLIWLGLALLGAFLAIFGWTRVL